MNSVAADLLVAHPLPEQAQDVLLALGERLGQLVLGRLAVAHPLGQQARDGRVQVDLAGVGGAHGRGDLLGLGVLEHVAGGAGLQGRR